MTAERSEAQPVYKKISLAILEQIRRGKLSAGAQLPSERDLGEQWQISRMTARQVYRHLEEEGHVSRSDRRGWFVTEGKFEFSLTRSVSFTNNLTAQGVQAGMELLDSERIAAPEFVRTELKLRKDTQVQSVRRLLRIRGEPALTETLYFVPKQFPGILDLPLTGSLLPIWRERYDVRVGSSENRISGGWLSDSDAKALGVRKGSPGIFLSQTMFDQSGEPFAHTRQHCRNDIAEFAVTVAFK